MSETAAETGLRLVTSRTPVAIARIANNENMITCKLTRASCNRLQKSEGKNSEIFCSVKLQI